MADYTALAESHSAQTGIPVSVYLAIIQSESAGAARDANALFGVKCTNPPCFSSPTWEVVNGQRVDITADFQAYPSADAAFSAFDHLALGMAGPVNGNPSAWLQRLNGAGYATNPTWWQSIISLAGGNPNPTAGSGQASSAQGCGYTILGFTIPDWVPGSHACLPGNSPSEGHGYGPGSAPCALKINLPAGQSVCIPKPSWWPNNFGQRLGFGLAAIALLGIGMLAFVLPETHINIESAAKLAEAV